MTAVAVGLGETGPGVVVAVALAEGTAELVGDEAGPDVTDATKVAVGVVAGELAVGTTVGEGRARVAVGGGRGVLVGGGTGVSVGGSNVGVSATVGIVVGTSVGDESDKAVAAGGWVSVGDGVIVVGPTVPLTAAPTGVPDGPTVGVL